MPPPSLSEGAVVVTSPIQQSVVLFVTHGLMNAALLSPWNPIRCAYFSRECSTAEDGMLNWLALSLCHVHVLLACLAYTAAGHAVLEQRVLTMTVVLMVASLSTGLYMLEHLNRLMAALQAVVYGGLLGHVAWTSAVQNASVHSSSSIPTVTQLRSASFDSRRQLPVATVAVAVQFALAAYQIVDSTFGRGPTAYHSLGYGDGVMFDITSQATLACQLWIALLLGASVVMATRPQQKALLVGHAAALFCRMLLLEHQHLEETSRHAAGLVWIFAALLLALLGAY